MQPCCGPCTWGPLGPHERHGTEAWNGAGTVRLRGKRPACVDASAVTVRADCRTLVRDILRVCSTAYFSPPSRPPTGDGRIFPHVSVTTSWISRGELVPGHQRDAPGGHASKGPSLRLVILSQRRFAFRSQLPIEIPRAMM
ncbi:hypothetical protein KM043_006740 [Ampulex compressa]|nr:hypothetical protein KM043_006740 [Ampulex compressa]